MADLPREGEDLLATAPDEFVSKRQQVVRELKKEGRADDAEAVGRLRKPSAVVSAVNRAARNRPKAAQAAAEAAVRVRDAQVGNDADAFADARRALDDALDLLSEVALACLAPAGKSASEAMQRRVRVLLRNAVTDDDARDALARGVLREEVEASGFATFAGASVKPSGRKKTKAGPTRAERAAAEKREQKQALRDELELAEGELRATSRAVREAEREHTRAERAVEALRAKLERLD